MTTLAQDLKAPTKQAFYMVTFEWNLGLGTAPVGFTNWNGGDLAFSTGPVCACTPSMAVMVGANTGTFEDKGCEIILPIGVADGFVDRLSSGEPWPQVKLTIYEVTIAPGENPGSTAGHYVDKTHALTVFVGSLNRTIRNYQGRNNAVYIRGETIKSALRIPLGAVSNDQCVSTFACFPCSLGANPQPSLKQLGLTVTAISGKVVTVTGASVPLAFTGGNGKYFHRGYLEHGDLRIGIRDWDAGAPTLFYLVREPPQSWIGLTNVNAMPGCDKSKDTCVARWDNEGFFTGLGAGIPNYNPLYEGKP